jgi:hypothetical protein
VNLAVLLPSRLEVTPGGHLFAICCRFTEMRQGCVAALRRRARSVLSVRRKGSGSEYEALPGSGPLTALGRLFPVAGSAVAIKPWPECLNASVPPFALFALEPVLFPLLRCVIMAKVLAALGGVSVPACIACLALVNLDLHLGGVEHFFLNLQR